MLTTWLYMILFLLSGGWFASGVLNVRLEKALLFWVLGSMLCLYGFGVFHLLEFGGRLLIAAAALAALAGTAAMFKRPERLRNFFTPALAVLLAWSMISFFANFDRSLCNWDEISYWGLAPKLLFATGKFSCETHELMMHGSYPPGMALWHWLNLRFYGSFNEHVVLMSSDIFNSVLLISMLSQVEWRNRRTIVGFFLLAPVAVFFFFEMFRSCYADAPVGLLFGAGAYMAITADEYDWKYFFKLLMIAGALFLIKNVGGAFGWMLIGLSALCAATSGEWKRHWRSVTFGLALTAAGFAALKWSWSFLIAVYECPVIFSGRAVTPENLFAAFFRGDPPYTFYVLWRMIAYLFSPLPFFYPAVYAILFGLYFELKKSWCGRELIKWRCFGFFTLFGAFGFLGALYLYYLFEFSEYEAYNIASLDRYWNCFLLMIIFVIGSTLLNRLLARRTPSAKLRTFDRVLLVGIAVAAVGVWINQYRTGRYGLVAKWRKEQHRFAEEFARSCPDAGFALITFEGYGLKNFIFQYESPGRFVNLPSSLRAVKSPANGELDTVLTPEEYQELCSRADFVLLDRVDARFKDEFQTLFKGGRPAIKSHALYRVTPDRQLEETSWPPEAPPPN